MSKHKTGKIIVISGPSGVGKGTINSKLFEDHKLNLVYSVSMTTRKPRPGEVEGQNYFFATEKEFDHAVANNELIEHARFIGNSYGTPRKLVMEEINKGNNVVLEIEVDGATQVIRNEKDVLSIFLMPPSFYELQNRIVSRGTEDKEIIKKRLTKSLSEIPLKDNYQYVVQNDAVDNALSKVKDILIKEKLTQYDEQSAYERLLIDVRKLLLADYELFIEIIEEHLNELAPKLRENFTKNGLLDRLTTLLADEIYRYVLAYQNLKELENFRNVQVLVNTNILNIDFFGVKNRGFNKHEIE